MRDFVSPVKQYYVILNGVSRQKIVGVCGGCTSHGTINNTFIKVVIYPEISRKPTEATFFKFAVLSYICNHKSSRIDLL